MLFKLNFKLKENIDIYFIGHTNASCWLFGWVGKCFPLNPPPHTVYVYEKIYLFNMANRTEYRDGRTMQDHFTSSYPYHRIIHT